MHRYVYIGPVMEFNRCIADKWEGETVAPSESKARNNLIYQFKSENGRAVSSRISLPGKIIAID